MIERHVCSNGVRIIHEKMAHVRSVAIGIWIEAGSADEQVEENGIAHFIEHMLFKGTKIRSARSLAEEFDRLGGDLNAFTSKEMTCFYATVLSNHAQQAISIMADMFFNSTFDELEIDKEKSVVLDEIASVEDTPDDDVQERLWASMYPDHSIGRPVLGIEKTIATFDKQMILEFMERNYRPEKVVISIAGNYDSHLIQAIEELFGSFQLENRVLEKLSPPKFHPTVSLKVKNIEQSHICLGFPGLSIGDDRMHQLAVLDCSIGGAMSSRLFQSIREDLGLAYSIYSYYSTYSDAGAFVIYGGTAPEKTKELYLAMNQVIQVVQQEGLTEKEVQNAKEQLKGGFLLGLESSESRMYRNGSNELTLGKHKTIDQVVALIDQVTVDEVRQLAEELLQGKRALSVIGPKLIKNQMKI